MKTLVIGGTGLISTAVTRQLVERGDDVTLFNRGRTPVRFAGDVRLLTGDRTDHPDFEAAVRSAGPWDCVLDMICSAPDDARSLARACKDLAAQVVFCSSSSVYPKPADAYPVREDHRLAADFENGVNKITCETICSEAESRGDFALTIVRPGHTYGETGRVLHSLGNGTSYLDRLRRGLPVIVHGDGNGLWSALHCDDVARVFAGAVGNPTAYGKAYNAAGEEWFTWRQYHDRLADAMGAPPPRLVAIPTGFLSSLAPERAAQSMRSLQYPGIYDMSRARRELGFQQQISLTEGMGRTIRWLDDHGQIEPAESDPDYERVLSEWECLSPS